MLKVYRDDDDDDEDDDDEDGERNGKRRFEGSPRRRRGRRRAGGQGVGRETAAGVGVVADERSNAVNRETESQLAGVRGLIGEVGAALNTARVNLRPLVIARAVCVRAASVYVGIFNEFASCVMGMFKWLRKDFVQWDRNRRNNLPSPERRGLNNEAYRNALQAFLDRRREPGEGSEASQSPNSSPARNTRVDVFRKNTNSEKRPEERQQVVAGVPHVEASEVFEVGWVAGTEDRYLELIAAEWHQTRTALRRSSHPDCFSAVRADLDILTEIRHPNTLLLMGTTRTDEHGIVAIYESVDCTLYNYIHEQGERVSVQGAARCAGQLADALRHAHARGIVHGALSSHCVFLAASGSAKLGGWELAVRDNEFSSCKPLPTGQVFVACYIDLYPGRWENTGIFHITGNCQTARPYREWEERLRSEIFRWQAPEMFYGDAPSKACDVYALALVVWEMSTGRVPWSGFTEAEIERQYVHWERGVATDAYNFPPLLGNILETGLQLDPNKRKLDMNRTRRFLRRIELRYEEEEPTFVDRRSDNVRNNNDKKNNKNNKNNNNNNNNNPDVKTFNAPVATSPLIGSPATTPKRDSIETNNSLIGKKLFDSERSSNERATVGSNSHSKNETICRAKIYDDFDGRNDANFHSETEMYNSAAGADSEEKLRYESSVNGEDRRDEKLGYSDEKRQQRRSVRKCPHDVGEYEKRNAKNLLACESSFSNSSTVAETASSKSSGDESAVDAVTDLKKLKEIIAAKRSSFFYGNGTSQADSITPGSPDSVEVSDAPRLSPRSRERILGEARARNTEPCKPASNKVNLEPRTTVCKSPSEYDPTLIKPASHQNQRTTLQPQIGNQSQSSTSYFESSLWRKEKQICLSKMRKEKPDDVKDLSAVCNKREIPDKSMGSPRSDSTYVIVSETAAEVSRGDFGDAVHARDVETTGDRTSPMTPLQALKEALDRATEIINSGTASGNESNESNKSNESSPLKDFANEDVTFDETEADESVFESMNRLKLGLEDPDGEIKSIERSTNGDRDSLLLVGKTDASAADEVLPESGIASVDKERSKCVSFGQTICEDSDNPRLSSTIDDSLVKRLHDFTCGDITAVDYTDDPGDSLNCLAESSLVSTAMVFLSSKSQEKGCKSCQHRNFLARRRSLPAGLGQIRSAGNASPLGRLPIRRGEVPAGTVEDLYIDDDFGDNLNINMVLLEGEDEPDDQDLLSGLLHSPDA